MSELLRLFEQQPVQLQIAIATEVFDRLLWVASTQTDSDEGRDAFLSLTEALSGLQEDGTEAKRLRGLSAADQRAAIQLAAALESAIHAVQPDEY